jgi:hypothetical protein
VKAPAYAFVAALLSAGCSTILDLDHEYTLQIDEGGAPASGEAVGGSSGGSAHTDPGGMAGTDTTSAGATSSTGGQAGSSATAPVRHGTTTLSSSSANREVDIGAVAPDRSFLIFGTRFNSTNSSQTEVSGQITSAGKLDFRRLSAKGPEVPIVYHVVQPTASTRVQRGSTPIDAAVTRISLPTRVDLAHSFPLVTFRNSGSVYGLDDHLRAELTGPSELTLEMYQASSSGVAEWQIVSLDTATVQAQTVAVSGTATSIACALETSVATNKSWLLHSYQVADIGTGAAELMLRGRIEQTQAVFDRSATGASAKLTFYVVSFTDDTQVRSGVAAVSADSSVIAVDLATVEPSRSVPLALGLYQRGGSTSYAEAKNPGYASFTLELGDSQLTARRGPTGSAAELAWSLIELN